MMGVAMATDANEWAGRKAARAAAQKAEAKLLAKARAARTADPSGGKIVPGVRVVPDPIEIGARLSVRVNLAEHPLELMRARKRLDEAQYEAGTRFRAIYERAMIGAGRGIDYARVRVDGGKPGDPLSDDCANAHLELARLSRALGMIGYQVVQAVAGHGEPVSGLATRWPGKEAERAKLDYLTMRLREALDLLASDVWGAKGKERGRMQVVRM